MEHSYNNKRAQNIRRTILFMLGVAIIGLADASYLSALHVNGTIPYCTIIDGCDLVLNGDYALLFGIIPVAFLGVIYYGTIFAGILGYLATGHVTLRRFVAFFPIVGLLASIIFVYLQVAVIGSICIYCILSALTSLLLFIGGMYLIYQLKHGIKQSTTTEDSSKEDGETTQKTLSS